MSKFSRKVPPEKKTRQEAVKTCHVLRLHPDRVDAFVDENIHNMNDVKGVLKDILRGMSVLLSEKK